jgi:chemotaxis signal transduction protein
VSLRGEIVTVVDLAALHVACSEGAGPEKHRPSGVTTATIRTSHMDAVVVLRGGRDPLGLEVDGVEDIRDFSPGAAGTQAPTGLPGAPAAGRISAGVVADERGQVGVLDADGVFAVVEVMAAPEEEPAAIGEVGRG